MNNFKKMWKTKFVKKAAAQPSGVALLKVQKRGSFNVRPEENTNKLTDTSKQDETENVKPEVKEEDRTNTTQQNETATKGCTTEDKKETTIDKNKDLYVKEKTCKATTSKQTEMVPKEGREEGVSKKCESNNSVYENVDHSYEQQTKVNENARPTIYSGEDPNYDTIVLPSEAGPSQSDKENEKLLKEGNERKCFRVRERDYEEVDISPEGNVKEIGHDRKKLNDKHYRVKERDYEEVDISPNVAEGLGKFSKQNGKKYRAREREYEEVNISTEGVENIKMELDEYASVQSWSRQDATKKPELTQGCDDSDLIEPDYMTVNTSGLCFPSKRINSPEKAQTMNMKEGDVEKIEPDYMTVNTKNVSFLNKKGNSTVNKPELMETSDVNVDNEVYAVINKESKRSADLEMQDCEENAPAPPVPNKDKLKYTRDELNLTESKFCKSDEASYDDKAEKSTDEDVLYDLPYTKMETHALKMAMLSNDGDYSMVRISIQDTSDT